MNTKPLYNIVMRSILKTIPAENVRILPVPKSVICSLEIEEKIMSIEKIKASIKDEIDQIMNLTNWCIHAITNFENERMLLYIPENQVANGCHFFILLSSKLCELNNINQEAFKNNEKLNSTHAKETNEENNNIELTLNAFKTSIEFFKALRTIWHEYKQTICETEYLANHNLAA